MGGMPYYPELFSVKYFVKISVRDKFGRNFIIKLWTVCTSCQNVWIKMDKITKTTEIQTFLLHIFLIDKEKLDSIYKIWTVQITHLF